MSSGLASAAERIPAALRDLPLAERTFPALLLRQAAAHSARPLVTIGGQARSYAQMCDAVARTGALLDAIGVKPGERVAIMAPNRLETLDLLLGCSWIGAVPVALNVAARGANLQHVLDVSGARTMIVDPELQPVVTALERTPSTLGSCFTLGAPSRGLTDGDSWAPLPAWPRDGIEAHPVGPGDPACIIFTSGTTGEPKGVVCLQCQMFWWGVNTGWNLTVTQDDVLYTCLPLFHTNALSTFVQALLFGASCVVDRRFSASRFWARISSHGATVTYLLGAMVAILAKSEPTPEDRAHRLRVALAPATPPDLHASFYTRFGARLLEAYGSTETNHVIGAPLGEQRPGWMGRVLPGFEARVVGYDDAVCADGVPGELVLRPEEPYSFAAGYFGMPEQTLRARRNLWLHTGDQVLRTADGYFRFVDRLSDSIRRRGENVSALEVERVLAAHTAVADVAVFAVPSGLAEDEVMATVVLRTDSTPDPAALIRYCQPRLPYFAIPRYFDFVDQLPTTANGKVSKVPLRQRGISDHTWDREASDTG